jgi:hypothetical protein
MGKQVKVPVAAAGMAWVIYWGDHPTAAQRLALCDADKAHPGKKGSCAYACCLYAALAARSPVGLTHRIPGQPEGTLTPTEAKQFQEAAWKVHEEVNGKSVSAQRQRGFLTTKNTKDTKDQRVKQCGASGAHPWASRLPCAGSQVAAWDLLCVLRGLCGEKCGHGRGKPP